MPRLERQTGLQRTIPLEAKERSSKVTYMLYGITDPDVAQAFALANVPATEGGNLFEKVELEELEDTRDGAFKVTAHYTGPDSEESSSSSGASSGGSPEPVEVSVSFDIGGSTQKITHSHETVASYAKVPYVAPDFERGINVVEGVPEGLDIEFQETSFSIEMEFPAGTISNTEIEAIEAAAKRYNSEEFRGRAAGEVFFSGCRGKIVWSAPSNTLNYEFRVSKNITDGTLYGFAGVTKKGWDYAWVHTIPVETADEIIETPIALYIERVYHTHTFEGIGVST